MPVTSLLFEGHGRLVKPGWYGSLPGKTIIFLDEIQTVLELLPLLRYFYEDRPDIRIIAAASFLEFLLADYEFSMPVGRVEYFHLGPMDFKKFLLALDQSRFTKFIGDFSINDQIPDAIHENLLYYVKIILDYRGNTGGSAGIYYFRRHHGQQQRA